MLVTARNLKFSATRALKSAVRSKISKHKNRRSESSNSNIYKEASSSNSYLINIITTTQNIFLFKKRILGTFCLASENSRSGNSVAVEVIVDVGGIPRISLLESPRNADAAGDLVTASRNLDLCTGDVELGDASWVGVVDAELLDAEEVVAWGDARWDLHAVGFWRTRLVTAS